MIGDFGLRLGLPLVLLAAGQPLTQSCDLATGRLEELEVLNLSDTAVTDAGLKELKTKVLVKLSVRGCKKVTKAGLAAIKAQNPKVVIDGP